MFRIQTVKSIKNYCWFVSLCLIYGQKSLLSDLNKKLFLYKPADKLF